ncbi:MAG: hypothetical protein F4171_17620 [Gammaproteobacteria bacterium]|nr:hypothetical protein [Gammaproteobacteria bacterium]MYK28283.1 hypothetical protein [Gammaproteobacteria bacterium]
MSIANCAPASVENMYLLHMPVNVRDNYIFCLGVQCNSASCSKVLVYMYPEYVVWLQRDGGSIAALELFFSRRKAVRSHIRALKNDENGFRELVGEMGQVTVASGVQAEMRTIGGNLCTTKGHWRKSFLNLDAHEEVELSQRFQIPVEVVQQVSEMERAIAERRRVWGSQNAHTSAMVRKYVPTWISRIVRNLYR